MNLTTPRVSPEGDPALGVVAVASGSNPLIFRRHSEPLQSRMNRWRKKSQLMMQPMPMQTPLL